jgi:hypothetical protein
VSDHRLDDRGSIPGTGKRISPLACVQTSSEANAASYPMGTEGSFPGSKALTTHPISCRGHEEAGAILSLSLVACMAVAGQL